MLFNSYVFLFLFLPISWMLFRTAGIFKASQLAIFILVLASLLFYSYWNPPFVLLIVFSLGFNYLIGILASKKNSRFILGMGIAINLGLIAYFKYSNFFLSNLANFVDIGIEIPDIFLPLGISFFTFQQIAYIVDCYKGQIAEQNFLHYCLFVTFFPQLIAGPIVHHKDVMPQFSIMDTFRFNSKNVSMGLVILAIGLFKKVIIADTLSPWVAEIFDQSQTPMMYASWIGALCYTFQIYFDFSGYSEMALGIGYLFNIELPINFNSPYKSRSIVDFWRRWHMTLSRFLRDYLYIPLGGNRKGTQRRFINLMATMLLGGLWHGAAWTFVIWGGVHGLFLVVNNAWKSIREKMRWPSLPLPIAWFFTFIAVVFSWVLFRSASFDRALIVFQGMLGMNGKENLKSVLMNNADNAVTFLPLNERLLFLTALLIICVFFPASWHFVRAKMQKIPVLTAIFSAVLMVAAVIGMTRISEFLYFQF